MPSALHLALICSSDWSCPSRFQTIQLDNIYCRTIIRRGLDGCVHLRIQIRTATTFQKPKLPRKSRRGQQPPWIPPQSPPCLYLTAVFHGEDNVIAVVEGEGADHGVEERGGELGGQVIGGRGEEGEADLVPPDILERFNGSMPLTILPPSIA